ncbi:MAG: S1C family serine protease [Anaerolineae bacterium]
MDSKSKKRFAWIVGLGCGGILLLIGLAVAAIAFIFPISPFGVQDQESQQVQAAATVRPELVATQGALPTLSAQEAGAGQNPAPEALTELYDQQNPGVVNIQVFVERQGMAGQGAGSGFIIGEDGHIVTNNHVIAQAEFLTVIFFDGFQAEAEIVGTDPDSDLAVIKVDQLPENVHPLTLGDSNAVSVGEWVVAIGNPFGLGSSFTVGVVSAVGRTIASGATPFAIPQAIQTDAAINPGNSGGPLLNTAGEVIGVNAQIATGGTSRTNSGVGFAIPVNTVRRIVPVLIETGSYAWPWLGVRGGSVNLLIQEANGLPSQRGAYIHEIVGGPAAAVGLQGSTGSAMIEGFEVPTGGDVVTYIDGTQVEDYSELQLLISQKEPGDTVTLTVMRNGDELQIDLELEARPVP